ncbi:hypothetical protein RFI_21576, partial [Reticulomyxa filosa]
LYRSILSEAEKEAGYYSNLFGSGRKKRMLTGSPNEITPGSTWGKETATVTNAGSGGKKSGTNNGQEKGFVETEKEQQLDEVDENCGDEENDENKNSSNFSNQKNGAGSSGKDSAHKRKSPEQNEIDQSTKSQKSILEFFEVENHWIDDRRNNNISACIFFFFLKKKNEIVIKMGYKIILN